MVAYFERSSHGIQKRWVETVGIPHQGANLALEGWKPNLIRNGSSPRTISYLAAGTSCRK